MPLSAHADLRNLGDVGSLRLYLAHSSVDVVATAARRARHEMSPGVCRILPVPFDVSVRVQEPHGKEAATMWDTVQTNELHLSHDLLCPHCGHAAHSYLACSDACDCLPTPMPGTVMLDAVELAA